MRRTVALACTAVALTCTALALASCRTPGGEAGARGEREEGLLRTTLDNGLNVVLVEDHSAPVVALNVWVRTGSADERPTEAGMAHVFEHMLFKGTERRSVGEIARTVEAAGGHINAFTTFDITVYHITMASRDAALGVDVLADAVQHSTFDAAELAKEIEVVVEEIRRGQDSPSRVLSQALFDAAYAAHPYRRPVIGTEESVRSFERDDLLAFHRRWYVPNNMTFVAVGDFEPTALLDTVRGAFRDAEPRPDLVHPRAAEPAPDGPRAVVVRRDFEQTLFSLAYTITRFADADTAYLDLLSLVLGGGESSRLYRNVKDRQRLVHTIGAGSYTPLDPGLFFIDASLDPENLEAALRASRDEIARIQRFGPAEAELERARVNLLAQTIREKETMEGEAYKYGYYETLGGGAENEGEYLDRVRRATPDDIRRVAREYLVAERATVGALLAPGARPELDEGALLAALRAESDTAVAAAEQLRDGIRRYTLPNGLRVVVKRNDSIPLVGLRIAFMGGLLAESEATQGASSFMAEMLDRGTEQRSAAQIAAEVEGIAGSLSGFSGRNTFGLTGEFFTESLDSGLELFIDALLHPRFDPHEIEKLREERLAALRRREDSLAQKAFDLFAAGLYPGHPYRFPPLGTEESIKRLDRATLVSLYGRYARPGNGVLGVVGDVDPDAFVELLAKHLGDWDGEVSPLPERSPPRPPDEPRELSIEKSRNQVHIVMGFPGLALDDPDVPALDVLTQILAGQGGRLFLELRDKRSLAYAVSAFSIEGVDPGSFGVYIASDPEKLDASLAGLEGELKRLTTEPILDEEIRGAKSFLIGSQAISLQRFSTQATLLALDELYGLGATHHLDYEERIESVKREDLARVAGRIIQLDAPLVAIVK